jgi:hypothetical protein
MKERSKLGNKKEQAILALLAPANRNVEEAARAAGVGTRTLFRWMAEPEFGNAYREAKHAAFSQVTSRMHQMSGAAVTTLTKAMLDPATPPATRVRAAQSILDHASRADERENLMARLEALERSKDSWKSSGNK